MNNTDLLPLNEPKLLKAKDVIYRSVIPDRAANIDLNPLTCAKEFLPYLAKIYKVMYWDDLWSLSIKRTFVANARTVHRHIGTRWALEEVLRLVELSTVEFPAVIREGGTLLADGAFPADGQYLAGGGAGPYGFVVYINRAITRDMSQKVKKLIRTYTPVRTRLMALVYSRALVADGKYVADGAYVAGTIRIEGA